MRKRSFGIALGAAVMSVGLLAQPALADVGLPYTFKIDFISGADNGVKTPNFSSNASGKICVRPDLFQSRPAFEEGGGDFRYKIQLWQNKTGSDSRVGTFNFTVGSAGKQCYTGVPKNKKVYLHITKTVHVQNQLLAGDGKVTYT
ncbi:hypothetical protein LWF15_15835 [Kineosporia rhizophila]|uniref:hypothetical protein n=1 Tax=Kineosporia TaxID=49184 RepID=UPI000B14F616|nr:MULTISPECIES: hypothetical protein [Kineosporia]MCE0536973.1 hypothetical protein [Kineosporia rhizophila]GLY19130.1 hypothetical protein Kisp01_61440 [Kineosporia sp. NBRC 101677]